MTMLDNFRQNALSKGEGEVAAQAFLSALLSAHQAADAHLTMLRAYWNGRHRVRLTDRLRQFLTNNGFEVNEQGTAFSDNHMGTIVAALVDRLKVQGFVVPGEPRTASANGGPSAPGPIAVAMADWWEMNGGDALEKAVHEHAVALGDAYVIVEWDAEQQIPRFTLNSPELVRSYYDPADAMRMAYATKRWVVADGAIEPGARVGSVRLNVYYPDRIEKWIARSSAAGAVSTWERFEVAGEPWPLPWTNADGMPLGIPVVHYRNDDRGSDYGRSELIDAIPLQDALNKALVDGVKVADSQGWPQRWGAGLDKAPDEELAVQPGSILWTQAKDAKFGDFDAADPNTVIAWMQHLVAEMADVTGTPAHLFRGISGAWPSGEALKLAEAPLVTKARDRQVVFGAAWEHLAELAVRMHNANASGEAVLVLPRTGFDVVWESAEARPSESDRIAAVNQKQGLSTRQRLREYGYSEEEVERIVAEAEAEQQTMAEIAARQFDQGALQ